MREADFAAKDTFARGPIFGVKLNKWRGSKYEQNDVA